MSDDAKPGPTERIGSAVPVTGHSEMPSMRTDGPCITETLRNLELGTGSKPLPRSVLDGVRSQAESILLATLGAYCRNVAGGEVGASGSGKASDAPPVAGRGPTGLLYGRVQSGKTLAMIALSAMAIDNGFRVILVFTSNYVKLVEQTVDRFRAIEGPIVHGSITPDSWVSDTPHIGRNLGEHGLVLVCAKDPNHLTTLREFLVKIGAREYPSIILDDEADQATPDTNTGPRARGKNVDPSTIHDRLIASQESIRSTLAHHVFIQVTATPYALLLQNADSGLRPEFTELLDPGEGYNGGESFFSLPHLEREDGAPPLEYVDEDEVEVIDRNDNVVPPGLAKSVSFFLISTAAQSVLQPASRLQGQNFLCHTSYKKGEHDKLARLIRACLEQIERDTEAGAAEGETGVRLAWAHDRLRKTVPEIPDLLTLIARMRSKLHRRAVYIVNSSNARVEFGRDLNFIVGGNILGRGLTIDNLLVTYYLRRAKISQMDTMLQHARMFGYRAELMPFTRVFLPRSLAVRFHRIHTAEQDLRQLLAESDDQTRIPVQVAPGLRVTRPTILDSGSLGAFRAGEHLYPDLPVFKRTDLGNSYTEKLRRKLAKALGGTIKLREFQRIPIDELVAIVESVRVSKEDAQKWDAKVIASVLRSVSGQFDDIGYLFVRQMRRRGSRADDGVKVTGHYLLTGAASGAEVKRARELGHPVLFMFQDQGQDEGWDGVPFWYPSLVFPPTMANQLFNMTE